MCRLRDYNCVKKVKRAEQTLFRYVGVGLSVTIYLRRDGPTFNTHESGETQLSN